MKKKNSKHLHTLSVTVRRVETQKRRDWEEEMTQRHRRVVKERIRAKLLPMQKLLALIFTKGVG